MKKSIILRIAVVVMVTALCTTCILSSTTTLAKYASFASGSTSGTIALWQVKVNDYDFSAVGNSAIPAASFNLFGSIKDTGGTDGDGNTDTHVTANRIAPGTKGAFTLKLENLSEVTAAFTVELVTSPALSGGFTLTGLPAGNTVTLAQGAAASTYTVNWVWAYHDTTATKLGASGSTIANTDGWADDTPLGIAGGTVTATLNVYAVQVD